METKSKSPWVVADWKHRVRGPKFVSYTDGVENELKYKHYKLRLARLIRSDSSDEESCDKIGIYKAQVGMIAEVFIFRDLNRCNDQDTSMCVMECSATTLLIITCLICCSRNAMLAFYEPSLLWGYETRLSAVVCTLLLNALSLCQLRLSCSRSRIT